MENVTLNNIYSELKKLRSEMNYIKEHMVDADSLLTQEEEARLEASMKEYKARKTIPFDQL